MQLQLICEDPNQASRLDEIGQRWHLQHTPQSEFALVLTAQRLELRKLDEPKLGAIFVDLVGGAVGHRRKFGGGKGQAIAKAAGLNKGVTPTILDGTAGLGRDAFVLASLGCQVQMVERHPVVAALLEDGLLRAGQDTEIGHWVQERMTLLHASSHDALAQLAADAEFVRPDVVYLDPMYPHPESKKKSALVKKEMRVFQSLVGADTDADALLQPALALASKRVVVKRPDYAEWLAGHKPTMAIETKKNRFDVYVNAAMAAD
ncbi:MULTISPECIES: class I SAM-dependent methyltransferase [Vibrio]|uniref:Ribosomal RNA small subunit methyltransferase J n=1 Tax=Vibrio proteolyticus NBRC 13287 TaxID=1219065 RepID=U2ZNL3_VIBPR|nr:MULTISPECIES: class I SAM-dependent methyltransferase [Vibrio]NAW56698.1 class I SAM-dependent methyltransferase [Vibrio sp. V36_P2S2PM302]NAX20760.1 class I SAM-dependent methyltransferase [Vibrio sp. V39_P1S14PM300]NAX25646.1 class I SAM-dependent methyltransferase [Vibrio sp. V38_P2S17PM301]NAX30397.1 class I SAM-dependent methyltransferase [Vibrio sp. V37_P2S8PM304]GAD69331.1 ribosomal RNA small subunit methyltransferase J [Vibrio proteolyticus NBRC 13287]